jgi:DMSO/TMAO reductase YedYZ molybdopterin-dependent catalytic subunit
VSAPDHAEGPRSERTAALLGVALGVAFTTCFVTGVLSHLVQDPPSWFHWPPRPAGLYRVTQGVHVTTGLMAIPLLVAKVWVVHPKLYQRPVVRSVAHGVERLALLPLVGGAVLLLVTGLGNVNLWRPWPFSFREGHHAAAWIVIGALVLHVAAQWATTRRALRRRPARPAPSPADGRLDRRGFLTSVGASSVLVGLLTAGQAFPPLRALTVLAPRRPDLGPQGFPVNRTAASVGLEDVDPATYRLVVEGTGLAAPVSFTYDDLRRMVQHEAELPIACVEGWSASVRWRGVAVRDLLAAAGATPGRPLTVVSLQESSRQRTAPVDVVQVDDPDLLLALEAAGEVLDADHGFPVRLVGPNRPGVHQTKWVGRIVVS